VLTGSTKSNVFGRIATHPFKLSMQFTLKGPAHKLFENCFY